MQENVILELKKEIIELSDIVRNNVLQAVQAFEKKDADAAKQVIALDESVNALTERISKRNLSAIALQAPVAVHLRMLGAYLKIVTDLERIGDLAVDMAKSVVRLETTPKALPMYDIITMSNEVHTILNLVIRTFVSEEIDHLHSLNEMDDVIDALHRQSVEKIEQTLEAEPQHFKEAIQYIKLLHALERIGDHATNIGEWTVYMKAGYLIELND